MDIKQHQIIQIVPAHKWGGCLAVVSEVKTWGAQVYVTIPANDGTPPGRAYIRLEWADFERVTEDLPPFIPEDEAT